MSFYQKITAIGTKYIPQHKFFKYGFNFSPMYRRSTGRVISASENLFEVSIKIPISWKNRNYVNSIFGGSMFSAVDPIPMVQLINIIGEEYVVWDKSATIRFKRPAKEHLYADFLYTVEEIKEIQERVQQENEIEIVRTTVLTNKNKSTIYCEVQKTLYIAKKSYYKAKRNKK